MTDQLPTDIAEAIEAFDAAAQVWGWEADQGTGRETAAVMASYEQARAALEAAVLKGIRGEWRPMSEAPRDGTKVLAVWVNNHRHGPHSHAIVWFRSDIQQWFEYDDEVVPPTHWAPIPASPPTDLGRSALADEGRGT